MCSSDLATKAIRLCLERVRKQTGKSIKHWFITELGHEKTERLHLHGVFEGNRVANAVNGSLWSLPIEFSMYLILSMLAMIGNSRWVYLAVAIASALVCLIWAQVSKEMLLFIILTFVSCLSVELIFGSVFVFINLN